MSTTTQVSSFRRIPKPSFQRIGSFTPSERWISDPFVQNTGVIAWQRARYAPSVQPGDFKAAPVECEIGFTNGVVLHYGGRDNHLIIYRPTETGRQVLRQVTFDTPALVFPMLKDRTTHSEHGILVRVSGYCDQVVGPDGSIEFRYRRFTPGQAASEAVRAQIIPSSNGSSRIEGLAMSDDTSRMRRVSGRMLTAEHVYMSDDTEIRMFVTPRHVKR